MSKATKDGLRSRQRLARESAILDAARQILMESGFEAMTMELVADRAMITKPTLYAYFPNKLEIGVACMVRTVRRADGEALLAEEGLSPVDRWAVRVRMRLEDKFRSPEITVARPDEPIRTHPEFRQALNELTEHLASIVSDGRQAGEMDTGIASKVAAFVFISVVANVGFEQLIADGRTTTEDTLRTLTAQLTRGIQPRAHQHHNEETD